jgi:hypothetical protein
MTGATPSNQPGHHTFSGMTAIGWVRKVSGMIAAVRLSSPSLVPVECGPREDAVARTKAIRQATHRPSQRTLIG